MSGRSHVWWCHVMERLKTEIPLPERWEGVLQWLSSYVREEGSLSFSGEAQREVAICLVLIQKMKRQDQ